MSGRQPVLSGDICASPFAVGSAAVTEPDLCTPGFAPARCFLEVRSLGEWFGRLQCSRWFHPGPHRGGGVCSHHPSREHLFPTISLKLTGLGMGY